MSFNPELRRHLWLEFTLHRIVSMPALLLLLLIAVALATSAGEGPVANSIAVTALASFGVLVFAWGSQQASTGISSEIDGRTWDTQRMTPLSPWSMTWGKLLGSSAYAWYGGTLALTVYVCTPVGELGDRIVNAGILVLSGLWLQGLSLLGNLHAVRKQPGIGRASGGLVGLVFGLFVVFPLTARILAPATARALSVGWYGFESDLTSFTLVSLLGIAAWTLIGVYRLMRSELQVRGGPWVWMAFVVCLMIYAAGFVYGSPSEHTPPTSPLVLRLVCGYGIGTGLIYALAFTEPKDLVAFRRLVQHTRRGEWRRASEEVPCWLATVPLVILIAIVLLALPSDPGLGVTKSCLLALVLFVLRDLGVLVGFNLATNPKRADLAALLYIALLYTLLPFTLAAAGADSLAATFWPRPDATFWAGVAPVAAQLLLIGAWLQRRWRRTAPALGRHNGGMNPSNRPG